MDTHLKYPDRFARITTDETYLRKPSKQVDIRDEQLVASVRPLIQELEDILIIDKDWAKDDGGLIGFGLAFCQLKRIADTGQEALRGGIVRIPNKAGKSPLSLDMLNPQIIKMERPFKYKREGCLSFPGQYMTTKRFRTIKLGFVDVNTLEPRELDLYGFEAVVLQHEVDHHDGLLYKDRHQEPTRMADDKLGPNDPCPCGKKRADGMPVKAKKCDCGSYSAYRS